MKQHAKHQGGLDRAPGGSQQVPAPLRIDFALGSTLAAAVFAVFSAAYSYPLLNGWDDHIYVTNVVSHLSISFSNVAHWFSTPHHGCYLPVTMLSYMLDRALWGLNGGGCHFQNVFWHAVAVLGLFSCLRMFGVSHFSAFLCSMFFALHPQRVESVAWISERKDVLCAAFYFWSVYAYLRSDGKGRWPLLSFILFLASFLAKPMAASLPVSLFLLGIVKNGPRGIKKRFIALIPFFAVVAALAPLTYFAHLRMGTVGTDRLDSWRQFLVVLHNLVWYFVSTFKFHGLAPIYPKVSFDAATILFTTAGAIAALATLAAIFVWKRRVFLHRAAPLTLCWGVSLAPVAGIVPIGFIDYADRYSYIPGFFVALALGMLLDWLRKGGDQGNSGLKRTAFNTSAAALSVCVVASAAIDIRYVGAWQNIRSLHEAALEHVPPNNEAVKFLADLDIADGRPEEALALADILRSMRREWMRPKDVARNRLKADYITAVAAFQSGKSDLASLLLEKVRTSYSTLAKNKNDKHALADLKTVLLLSAACFDMRGDAGKAAERYRELADAFDSNDRNGLYYRGVALIREARYAEAAAEFKKILSGNPSDAEAVKRLKFCLRELGR